VEDQLSDIKTMNVLGLFSPREVKSIRDAIGDTTLDANALVRDIPVRLFIFVALCLSDDYQERMAEKFPLPVSKETTQKAREFVQKQFAGLPRHPAFGEAMRSLMKRASVRKCSPAWALEMIERVLVAQEKKVTSE
jgi:hypothetical protein